MPDLSARWLLPERMDGPCDEATFAACLRDLATVNRLTGAHGPTIGFLREAVRRHRPTRPLRIVDVGGGYGDALRLIARWARRRGIAVALTSVDRSPHARRAGERATVARDPIRFVTADIFDWTAPEPVDLVVSGLFAHHLDDAALVRFVSWMERTARLGWFINDLHRHPVPFHVFRAWSRLAGWHPFVRHDGPVSIGRAFRRDDWARVLGAAAVPPGAARVRWRVPFRFTVARFR